MMAINNQKSEEQLLEPSDDLENLFIGRIDEVIVKINGSDEARLEGEVLLYGRAEGNLFVVERLRRVALYGALLKPSEPDEIGLISLAGPLDDMTLKPDQTGEVTNLRLQLHYHALSGLEPLYRGEDSVFPQVEALAANLTWEWIPDRDPTEPEVLLNIGLPASDLIGESRRLGLVSTATFKPLTISFYRARSGLRNNQGFWTAPKNPPCSDYPPANETLERRWPLRFINVSGIAKTALQQNGRTLEENCIAQIAGVGDTWWQKAALNLTMQPDIEDGNAFLTTTQGSIYRTIDNSNKERNLASAYNIFKQGTLIAPPYFVEVYLVEKLTTATHGGVTRDNGQASVYCILEAGKLSGKNRYLLAHEMGHALGLKDLKKTIMKPTNPNSPIITYTENCEIIAKWPGDPPAPGSIPIHPIPGDPPIPLNAIVRTVSGSRDCFRPD